MCAREALWRESRGLQDETWDERAGGVDLRSETGYYRGDPC